MQIKVTRARITILVIMYLPWAHFFKRSQQKTKRNNKNKKNQMNIYKKRSSEPGEKERKKNEINMQNIYQVGFSTWKNCDVSFSSPLLPSLSNVANSSLRPISEPHCPLITIVHPTFPSLYLNLSRTISLFPTHTQKTHVSVPVSLFFLSVSLSLSVTLFAPLSVLNLIFVCNRLCNWLIS